MDYLEHLVLLAVDGVVIALCYSQYRKIKTVCVDFMNAQNIGINPPCSSKKELDGKVVIVQGIVKALNQPIKSISSSAKGVIQRLTIKEHALTRGTYGYWNDRERIVDEKYNSVPFKLHTVSYDVKITCPLEAEYLTLDIIQDKFEPSFSNFLGRIFGYFLGFHQQGFQYTEYLLKEDTVLTGFGELNVNAKGELQLIPPSDGSVYILTTLEPSVLIRKLNSDSRVYKWLLIASVSLAAVIFAFIVRKWWTTRQEVRRKREFQDSLTKARLNRERTATENVSNGSIACVACLDNAREVLLLPCDHVCLCSDCVRHVNTCPVCREPIQMIIPAFIS